MLFRSIYKMLSTRAKLKRIYPDQAEDIIQNTMVVVIKKAPVCPADDLYRWVQRVFDIEVSLYARTLSAHQARLRSYQKVSSPEGFEFDKIEKIQSLTEEEKTYILCRYQERLTYDQIGKLLNCGRTKLWCIKNSALGKIKQWLEK